MASGKSAAQQGNRVVSELRLVSIGLGGSVFSQPEKWEAEAMREWPAAEEDDDG